MMKMATVKMKMKEGFLDSFMPRLKHCFLLFMDRKPEYGEERHDFVERMRPVHDEYMRLREEFHANFV